MIPHSPWYEIIQSANKHCAGTSFLHSAAERNPCADLIVYTYGICSVSWCIFSHKSHRLFSDRRWVKRKKKNNMQLLRHGFSLCGSGGAPREKLYMPTPLPPISGHKMFQGVRDGMVYTGCCREIELIWQVVWSSTRGPAECKTSRAVSMCVYRLESAFLI